MSRVDIRPQPGPQTAFLSTPADIAIYGGAAGGGKTFGLLLDPLRHLNNGLFGGVIFRRTTKQVRNEGGLWDEAQKLYVPLGFRPLGSRLDLIAPSGMRLQFAHLEHEKNVFDWQGAQVPFMGFDELTHFTEYQFFYMISRNRSTSGAVSYVRATTNPKKSSWVRKFISWWIDEKTGLAIPERSGVLRWFVRREEKLIWADTREELVALYGEESFPLSVTFIPAKLSDNKILEAKDPAYRGKLMAMNRVERMQLLDGNWNVEPAAGLYFKKHYFEILEAAPAGINWLRYWDFAGTEGGGDYTVGTKIGKKDGITYIGDVVRDQLSPGGVERMLLNTARRDSVRTKVGMEQEPGSAGKADAENKVKLLNGFDVEVCKPSEDKVTRAGPFSAQAEAGNVKLIRGDWNEEWLREHENFPDDDHDDQVDSASGGFNLLNAENVGDWTEDMAKSKVHSIAPSLRGNEPRW